MKKIKGNVRRIVTIMLAAVLFVTSIPAYAYATELSEPDILAEEAMEAIPEDGDTGGTPEEEELLPDIDMSTEPVDETVDDGNSSDIVMKGGYIEMPWDNNAPAADDDLTWSQAIEGIVDDVQDGTGDYLNEGYVSEPETVQSRFPDYDNEKDILKYFTDTYPVTRSQNPYGTCWAHSAVALTEFYMLKKGLRDSYGDVVNKDVNYSELQLAYFCYHNSPNPLLDTGDSITFGNGNNSFLDFGGNLGFAAQSMIRYSGITDEEEGSTAYSNAANVLQNGLADEYAHDHDQAYLKNEYEVNLKSNPKLAKQAILENGIIGTSFYWDSKYLANDGKSFYNGTENKTNHAVAIVGWDDDYSRTNFKTDPGENGAWLIRNSWTTIPAFSSYSYFWISYKDTSLNSTAYVYEIADRDRGEVYDNNYYYDSQLHNTCSAPSGKVANVFTAQKTSEELKAVSLDITNPYSAAVDYTIRVYRGLTDVSDPESGTLMDTITGTLPFAGKYTIPLNSAISLTRDECFSIVVDTGSDRIDRECDFLWNNQINMDTNINSGESFYYEGGSWKDMILRSSEGNYGNTCIRALTNNTTSELPTKIVSLSTAGITSDSVILKWSAVKNADSYQILRASGDGDYAVVQTVSAGVRKYEDTGLTALTDYKYKVCPVRDGVTSWDDVSPELAVRTKPGIPELTMANVGGYSAMVTWTEVKGCDGYEIRWRSSGYNGYTYFRTNETEYRIRNLTPESEYTVEVYPYTGSESSLNYSSPGSTVFSTGTGNPVAVGNLRAEPYSTSAIMLTWEVPEDVSTIRVEKSEDNGISYSLLGRYSYNTKSYYVSNLNNTTKYTFRVTAVYTEDNAGNPVIKAVSEPVSAYAKLPGVKNLKVTSSFEDKSMTVTWSGVANAAYYAVYRKMSSESEYIPLVIVPAGGVLSYTDTTIVPGRYYFYRVFGCRENVLTDEQGTIVSSYGEMIELDPVENVNTDVRSTSAAVTWDTVSGADSYVIEQYADNSWNEFITILGGQTNEAALTGLSPKTYYRFRMFAKSEDGAVSVEQIGEKLYYAYTYFNFTTTEDDRESLSKSDFSFVSSSYTYDGQPHSAGITTDIEEVAAAGLTFAYAPVTNGTAGSFTGSVPVNAGTWQIKIQTPQTGNYKAATLTDPEWRFTINRAPLTVTANACTITYGEAPKGNGVSYSGFAGSDTAGDLGGTLTFSYDYKKYDDAGGSYTITPGGLVSDNYEISYVSGKLTVDKKPLIVKWSDTYFVYDGNAHLPSALLMNLENGDICTVSVSGEQVKAGTYKATASITGEDSGNYELGNGDAECDFTIAKAGMSVAVITLGQGLTYNGTEQTQTVTGVRVNGLLLDPADYSVTGNKGTNAGQYTLTVTARDNSDYTGTAAKSFTIAKKAIIPFVCVTGTYSYTGSAITPSYYVKDGSAYLALSDYSVTVTDNINAGQGLITVKAAEGGNYSFSDVKRYFDIGKALHGDEQVSLDVKSGTGGYGELKRYMEAGGSLGDPVVISGQDVFDEMPCVNGTVLSFTVRNDNSLAGSEAVMKIPVNGADNYLTYNITVTVKVLQNDSYADIIEELRKDDDNKDIQVSSNTVRKDDGSTDTTITVGGKDVSKVTVDTDGRITEETNIWISGLKSRYHYTGASVTPGISVFDGTKKLTEGTDYSLKYKNNKAVGRSAEMILTFKGNYATTEQQVLTFEIIPAVIGTDVMIEDLTITGNDRLQKPVPTIIMKATGKKLPKNNFAFVYKNSDDNVVDGVTEAGEYTVTITTANGNFVDGTEDTAARITVKDKPHQIMGATVKLREGKPKKFVYTGEAIIPGAGRYILTIKDGRENIELTEDLDYTVEYSNNTDPGNALVTFKGMGDYAGTKQTTFRIEKGRMLNDNDDITVEFADGAKMVPYAKGGAVPGVIVRDRNTVLIMGRDYTVSYSGNKAVTDGAEAVVSIRGKGNYKGEIARRFSIVKQDIGNLKDGIFVSDKVKTKKSDGYKKPAVTITDLDGKKLKEKTDYEICDDYKVLDDGYVKVTIKAADNGNYKEKVSVTYRCLDADKMLSKAKVMNNIEIQTYTGSEIKLSEDDLTGILYMGNKRSPDLLIPGEDFEVLSYTGNIKKGTAKVTLKGIGEYGGTKTLNFKIKAKKGIYTGVIRDGSW